MANPICPECFHGLHDICIRQGCYCECQLPSDPYQKRCGHGELPNFCEFCELRDRSEE